MQCRERWCNVLDPDLSKNQSWTSIEDAALKAVANEYGTGSWSKIAKELQRRMLTKEKSSGRASVVDRNPKECKQRFGFIQSNKAGSKRAKTESSNVMDPALKDDKVSGAIDV